MSKISLRLRLVVVCLIMLGGLGLIFLNSPSQAVVVDEEEEYPESIPGVSSEDMGRSEGEGAFLGEKGLNYMPGEIIVKFKEGVNPEAVLTAANLEAEDIGRVHSIEPVVERFKKEYKLEKDSDGWYWFFGKKYKEIDELDDETVFNQAYKQMDEVEQNLYRSYRIRLPEGTTPEEAITKLKDNPDIEYVEPNYLRTTLYIPNDSLYTQQWAHQNANIEAAWDFQKGSPNVVIAVIDTGVDYNHPDLAANIWHDAQGRPGKDFVDLELSEEELQEKIAEGIYITGEDYNDIDYDPSDYVGHGTHCAGIVSADNNGIGVVGVAPDCKIMALRAGFCVIDDGREVGALPDTFSTAAIKYAVDNGAKVISMSFGGGSYSEEFKAIIDYAASKQVVLVAAAGNSNSEKVHYPAAYDNVIAVGATDVSNTKAVYSNYGNWIDVAAPGQDILSTVPSLNPSADSIRDASGYKSISGTSMACPYVAGVAGLILSHYPEMLPEEIAIHICATANDVIASPLRYCAVGSGRVNVLGALTASIGPHIVVNDYEIEDKWVAQGDRETITITLKNFGQEAYNVNATLSRDDLDVSIIEGKGSYGNLANGLTAEAAFSFLVSQEAPIGEAIRLDVNISAANYQNSFSLPLKVNFPFQEGFVPPNIALGTLRSSSPVISDLNGDGENELVIIGESTIYVFNSDGTNKNGWPKEIDTGDPYHGMGRNIHYFFPVCAVGDVDKDGKKEIVTLSYLQNERFNNTTRTIEEEKISSHVIIWREDGRQLLNEDYSPPDPANLSYPALVDLDGNGDLELIFAIDNNIYAIHHKPYYKKSWFFKGWTVKEWTCSTDSIFYRQSPAIGDIDNDGFMEVVINGFANNNAGSNKIYVFRRNGSLYWEKELDERITNSPVLADVDGNGTLEILFHTKPVNSYAKLNALNHDGSELFPAIEFSNDLPLSDFQRLFNDVPTPSAIGDIDGDGDLEITFGDYYGRTYIYHHNGTPLAGWPQKSASVRCAAPILVDLDSDGRQEIIIGGRQEKLYAWDYKGLPVLGFPMDLSGFTQQMSNFALENTPTIKDLDKDGDLELVMPAVTPSGKRNSLLVFDLPYADNVNSAWPMYQHDEHRSGVAGAAQPVANRPPSIGEVTLNGQAVDSLTGVNPFTVSFDASGVSDPDGDPIEYVWDFGDGSSTNYHSPTHKFAISPITRAKDNLEPKEYRVSLTVQDDEGESTSKEFVIRVKPDFKITAPKQEEHVSNSGFSIKGIVEPEVKADVKDVLISIWNFQKQDWEAWLEPAAYNAATGEWEYPVLSPQVTPADMAEIWARLKYKSGAGRGDYAQGRRVYIDDTSPPTVSITSPSNNGSVLNKGFVFQGTAEDDSGVIGEVRISVYDYGRRKYTVNKKSATYDTTTKQWTFEVLPSHITLGKRAFLRVRVRDKLNNWSSQYIRVKVAQPPKAYIWYIWPRTSYQGNRVRFYGYGRDRDGRVVAYKWRSDKDGNLSSRRHFSTTRLSAGKHTIYLKVRDNQGNWSKEVSRKITVKGRSYRRSRWSSWRWWRRR